MIIYLFISSVKNRNTGFGGHYRSLLSYHAQLEERGHKVDLMHYNELSETILDSKLENLLEGVQGDIPFITKTTNILNSKPDVVISFADGLQSRLLRFICLYKKIKYIQVIAGGPNRKLPLFFNNCIYFSTENLNNKIDYSTNKILLTNRIDDYECDRSLIYSLEKEYPKKSINVLRVSRISNSYYDVFTSTIKFHALLLDKGFDVQTHLIGILQDQEVYNNLNKMIENIPNIFIITDKKYTNDVKMLMDYYDVVIGIGRGFWEAVNKKKIVLGYSDQIELPIVVDETNYEAVRKYNFSPRVNVEAKYSIENNLSILSKSITYLEFQYKKYLGDYSSNLLPQRLEDIIITSKKDRLSFIILSLITISISEIYYRYLKSK